MSRRPDGRAPGELRPVRIVPDCLAFPEGSAEIQVGLTRVLCTVTVDDSVPAFLRGRGSGWVTAEYAMLPRSTLTRTSRDNARGGRAQEIQRLIGRSLRAAVNLELLGERTFTVDCDVLQADGGTRTASVTGAYVALERACQRLKASGRLKVNPLVRAVAAVSVGIVEGETLLDLCYGEDAGAEVDFNVVMTDQGEYVEIQATAEGRPFSRPAADQLLDLARAGIAQLLDLQRTAIQTPLRPPGP